MERLEKKKINGRDYYYYSKWGWRDGKCRRLWQKYLGKLEDIVKAVDGGCSPAYAEIFEYGLSKSLWNIIGEVGAIEKVDSLCPKRQQNLSPGWYIGIAALNRAIEASSKVGIWEWITGTSLIRELPAGVNQKQLSSQRFWDHMDAISADTAKSIWENIIAGTVSRENIDTSRISYDGTNFYTFISTFNVRNTIAKRGKNKQGRSNLRQVSYALFCTKEGIPLYYDVYDGNRNDAKVFPDLLDAFGKFIATRFGAETLNPGAVTLIFDKGSNSAENFSRLDKSGFDYVGSLKLCEHGDIVGISSCDERFQKIEREGMDGIRAFSVVKQVYGKNRLLVVMHNRKLLNDQIKTVNNDIAKAIERLSELRQKLEDRRSGLVKGGRAPTAASINSQVESILKRPYLKDVIKVNIHPDAKVPTMDFELMTDQLDRIADTYLGKKIIVTREGGGDIADIISTYHSQYIIEHAFRDTKNARTGTWWPMFHWTDQKIHVHGLYCTIAVLIRSILHRRIKMAGINISQQRMLKELSDIREVVNIFHEKGRKGKEKRQTVFSRLNQVQEKLFSVLFA